MARYVNNKDMDKFIVGLVNDGWTFQYRKKHMRLLSPDGKKIITVSTSTSDQRAIKNTQAILRQWQRSKPDVAMEGNAGT